MLIITGTIKVESEEELARIRPALVRRAIKSRSDEGNIEYVFTQNLEDLTEIHLIEKWEDEAALNAHLEVPDEEFGNVIASAKIEKAIVTCNEASNERVLLER